MQQQQLAEPWPRPLRLNMSDKNRCYIGKSQSKRPPKRTQRPPHLPSPPGAPTGRPALGPPQCAPRSNCPTSARTTQCDARSPPPPPKRPRTHGVGQRPKWRWAEIAAGGKARVDALHHTHAEPTASCPPSSLRLRGAGTGGRYGRFSSRSVSSTRLPARVCCSRASERARSVLTLWCTVLGPTYLAGGRARRLRPGRQCPRRRGLPPSTPRRAAAAFLRPTRLVLRRRAWYMASTAHH
jgi:hypothetical protein